MPNAEIFTGLAAIYRAGAHQSRAWVLNGDRQQDAQVFDAMADEAERQAAEAAE